MGQQTKTDRTVQVLTLGIDAEIFAVEVEHVREILDLCPISRVPHAPGYLLGVIDVRRRTVPVIDLRVKLGLPPVPPTAFTRIIVLDVDIQGRAFVVGLVADRVYEVAALAAQDVEDVPEIGVAWQSQHIKGVARRDDAFVIVLDLNHLFCGDDKALITVPDVVPDSLPAVS